VCVCDAYVGMGNVRGDREGTQALIFTSLSSGMDKRLFSIISNHNYTWQD